MHLQVFIHCVFIFFYEGVLQCLRQESEFVDFTYNATKRLQHNRAKHRFTLHWKDGTWDHLYGFSDQGKNDMD